MSGREDLRFNPEQFGQVQFHSTICRARNGSIDREQRLLELPGLAQAFRQRAGEARDQEIVLLSVQGPQCARSKSRPAPGSSQAIVIFSGDCLSPARRKPDRWMTHLRASVCLLVSSQLSG